MLYEFEPPRLEERYCDERYLKKKYGVDIAQGMMKFLGVLLAAENAYDIKSKPQFFMEHKKGNLSLYYSVFLRQEAQQMAASRPNARRRRECRQLLRPHD